MLISRFTMAIVSSRPMGIRSSLPADLLEIAPVAEYVGSLNDVGCGISTLQRQAEPLATLQTALGVPPAGDGRRAPVR
jgi:hypothetical protein